MSRGDSIKTQRTCLPCRRGWVFIVLCLFATKAYSQESVQRPVTRQSRQIVPSPQSTAGQQGDNAPASRKSSRSITPRRGGPSSEERAASSSVRSLSVWKLVGVLAIAVAGILGAAKLFKSWGPFQAVNPLPHSVYHILGVASLPPRHTLYLIEVGQKLILVASTGDSLTNLAEISDPQEIASIRRACQAGAAQENGEESIFLRLFKQTKPEDVAAENPEVDQPNAREELEARLKSFAHS